MSSFLLLFWDIPYCDLPRTFGFVLFIKYIPNFSSGRHMFCMANICIFQKVHRGWQIYFEYGTIEEWGKMTVKSKMHKIHAYPVYTSSFGIVMLNVRGSFDTHEVEERKPKRRKQIEEEKGTVRKKLENPKGGRVSSARHAALSPGDDRAAAAAAARRRRRRRRPAQRSDTLLLLLTQTQRNRVNALVRTNDNLHVMISETNLVCHSK